MEKCDRKSKIRSQGQGRGLGYGEQKGPLGLPRYSKRTTQFRTKTKGKGRGKAYPIKKATINKQKGPIGRQSHISADELRDFFVIKTGGDDNLIDYSELEKEFGKKHAYSFHERGLIYEPVHGKAKLI